MSLSHFVQYHNAIPIALGVLFLGAGATFAATNPEAIYSAEQSVVSIDNTYIANKDVSSYSPQAQIVSVTEDADNYYVAYQFTTIDIKDSVWQDVVKPEVMTVSKADLGQYRDLGVYVTEQLKQVVDREIERLVATQEIERRNVTQKTVATAYGGLIGKFLDSTTEELPGYTPVVTPPPPPPQVAAAATPEIPAPAGEPATTPPAGETSAPSAPTMQVLGDNPARVAVGGTYSDLGASITGPTPQDLTLSIRVFVDGRLKTESIVLDTSAPRVWTIRYEATNATGLTSVERQVIIGEAAPAPAPEAATTTPEITPEPTPATTTPEVVPEPTPAPKPEPTPIVEPTPTPVPDSSTSTSSGQATPPQAEPTPPPADPAVTQ